MKSDSVRGLMFIWRKKSNAGIHPPEASAHYARQQKSGNLIIRASLARVGWNDLLGAALVINAPMFLAGI